MHGLGNDFVIFDAQGTPLSLTPAMVRLIADRNSGVGCNQLVVMEPPTDNDSDLYMRIYNADGGEVEACGNAARCVAALAMGERDTNSVLIETKAGQVEAHNTGTGMVTVDMGPARIQWDQIPLASAMDTLHVDIAAGPLTDPVAVSIGNPHAVFFVEEAEAIDLENLGPQVENHPLFPLRTNVEAVQLLAPDKLRMRVWERGVGITQACGTGACASLVAAHRRGLTGRQADVILDGGLLEIEWRDDDRVLMTGPVAATFTGHLHPDLLAEHR
ncbi:diaminopimelate epimerase [Magnetospira sp. QH-2]|nr:diaminopimelate epimerase [Magnetospira sp. QH-2]